MNLRPLGYERGWKDVRAQARTLTDAPAGSGTARTGHPDPTTSADVRGGLIDKFLTDPLSMASVAIGRLHNCVDPHTANGTFGRGIGLSSPVLSGTESSMGVLRRSGTVPCCRELPPQLPPFDEPIGLQIIPLAVPRRGGARDRARASDASTLRPKCLGTAAARGSPLYGEPAAPGAPPCVACRRCRRLA